MPEKSLNPSPILAAYYGFDLASTTIDLIKTGAENKNYLVESQSGKFVLRLYNDDHSLRGKRSKSEIVQELAFVARAQSAGIPAPQVVENQAGDTITVIEHAGQERFCAMFHFIAGQSPTRHSEKTAAEVGKIVNTLFAVGKSFADEQDAPRFDMLTYAFQTYEKLRPTHQGLAQLYQRVTQEREKIQLDRLSCGFAHNDLKLGNLLFDEAENCVAVLDFDDFRYCYLLEDVVMAALHDLHNVDENLLRSGNFPVLLTHLKHPQLMRELHTLSFFLRLRLLHDASNYVDEGLMALVDDLFADEQIQKYILETA